MAGWHNGVHSSSLLEQDICEHGCFRLQLQLLQDLYHAPTRSIPKLYIIERGTSQSCRKMLCVL